MGRRRLLNERGMHPCAMWVVEHEVKSKPQPVRYHVVLGFQGSHRMPYAQVFEVQPVDDTLGRERKFASHARGGLSYLMTRWLKGDGPGLSGFRQELSMLYSAVLAGQYIQWTLTGYVSHRHARPAPEIGRPERVRAVCEAIGWEPESIVRADCVPRAYSAARQNPKWAPRAGPRVRKPRKTMKVKDAQDE